MYSEEVIELVPIWLNSCQFRLPHDHENSNPLYSESLFNELLIACFGEENVKLKAEGTDIGVIFECGLDGDSTLVVGQDLFCVFVPQLLVKVVSIKHSCSRN